MGRIRQRLGQNQEKRLSDFRGYLDNLYISTNTKETYRRVIQVFLKEHRDITQRVITNFLQKHRRVYYKVALIHLCRCLEIPNITFPPNRIVEKPRGQLPDITREDLYNYIKELIPTIEKEVQELEVKTENLKEIYLNLKDTEEDYEKKRRKALREYKHTEKKCFDFVDLRVIFLLLLDYGVRIREALELRTGNINFKEKRILFHTKTNKDRIEGIRDYVLNKLHNLIEKKGLTIPIGEIREGFEGEYIFYTHYTEKKPNKYESGNEKKLLLLRKLKYDLLRRDLISLNENISFAFNKTHNFRRALINYLLDKKGLDVLTVASWTEQTVTTVEKYVSEKTRQSKKKKVFEIINQENIEI